MKKIFLYLLAAVLLYGCYDDATTDATGNISLITIDEQSLQGEYNIGLYETLTIKPNVTQTMNKALTYTWEIGDKVYHGDVLQFKGSELGTYQCRLVVSNEDGKEFIPFVINVNTIFEEGVAILSTDPAGNSRLSFMLRQLDGTTEDYFYDYDCYTVSNPDEQPITLNATDLKQCNGNLLIACKGAAGQSGGIYYIDEKTFVLENIVTAPEYSDFRPTLLGVPRDVYTGTSFPIICENGSVYYFSASDGAITRSSRYPNQYEQRMIVNSHAGGYYDLYMWDKTMGGLCAILNSYGPYYCSKTFHCEMQTVDGKKQLTGDNYFQGCTYAGMVMAEAPKGMREEAQLIVFAMKGIQLNRVVMHYGWWVGDDGALSDNDGLAASTSRPFFSTKKDAPMLATLLDNSVLMADGNTVKKWFYSSQRPASDAEAIATIGSDQAVIDGMAFNPDHTKTYVAFHEPTEGGMNGHVWAIDTQTGDILQRHDNVCYKPTCIIYKAK